MTHQSRTLLSTATVALALAVPAVAMAQAPGESLPQPQALTTRAPATVERSYGMQLAAADILSLVTVFVGANTESESLMSLGSLGLVLAAPAVHLAHDNGASALRSAGLRVTLPLAGMLIGYAVGPKDLAADCIDACSSSSSGSLSGMLIGGGLGVVTTLIIDYTVLGKKTEKAPASWQPTIGASSNGFSVGAAGHF